MPPYAGLDEGFHVARVSFVAAAGRQPSADEPSVARYFFDSFNALGDVPPSFGMVTGQWSRLLDRRPHGWRDVPLDDAARSALVAANYEAQQASLYYALAAPIDRIFGTTQLRELLLLRLLAVPLGAVTALATALLAARFWGRAGFLAGLLLVATPTWITLTARAGNDALAGAALATALVLSARPAESWPSRIGEAASWAVAAAAKLYAWPAALLLPLLWPREATRTRRLVVVLAIAASMAATALDLQARTGHLTGKIELRTPGAVPLSIDSLRRIAALPWFDYAKVFAGSAIWTSGPHADFLRPPGVVLFLLPWALLVGAGLAAWSDLPRRRRALLLAAAAVFAAAEVGQAWGAIRQAVLGRPTAGAGLAGWYLHAFDPIWYGVGLGFAIAASAARRRGALVAVALVLAFAADFWVTEFALFPDYAGLATPEIPGTLFRWGGGAAWPALVRLGTFGLALPSPWLAVSLRALEAAAFGALTVLALRPGTAAAGASRGRMTV
jgi:hypothetical protein